MGKRSRLFEEFMISVRPTTLIITLVIFLLVLCGLCTLAFAQEQRFDCEVTNVVDGDTFDCKLNIQRTFPLDYNGIEVNVNIKKPTRIRILYVDCPEIRGSEKEEGLKTKEYASTVLTHFGPAELRKMSVDSFGRDLADVYLKGQWFAELLVTYGGCEVYEKDNSEEANKLRQIREDFLKSNDQ